MSYGKNIKSKDLEATLKDSLNGDNKLGNMPFTVYPDSIESTGMSH